MTDEQEKIVKAHQLEQQIRQLQQFMEQLSEQSKSLQATKDAIEQFGKLKGGEEALIPLANGIFVPAVLSGKDFFLNVGADALVPQTAAQVKTVLDEQTKKQDTMREELMTEYERVVKEIETVK